MHPVDGLELINDPYLPLTRDPGFPYHDARLEFNFGMVLPSCSQTLDSSKGGNDME